MPYLGVQTLKDAEIKRGSGTGDGSTVAFAIGWTPPSEQSLFITINGVTQQDAAYTISGSTLTFAAAPANADAIEWRGIQSSGTVITPADGTVGEAKIADDAVVLAKLGTTGTASTSTFLRGDMAWSAAGGIASVQVFTSSGTWTRPSGITKVLMQVQGAGGAGSRHDSTDASRHGGAGGGYAMKLLDVSSISTSTITVGAGGTATGANNVAGGNGGFSKWADGTNTITGNGGGGGLTTSNTPTVGATGVGGDVNIQGQASFSVNPSTGVAAGGAGNSMLGFAGDAHWSGYNPGSFASSGYGAGTGPGSSNNSLAAGGGIVIVWEYK